MVMQSSDFNRTSIDISRNIKIAAYARFKAFDKEYDQIVKKRTTNLKIEKIMGYEGFGAAPSKSEGDVSNKNRINE